MKKSFSTKRSRERSNGGRKQRKLDMGHFAPPMAKRPANLWTPLLSATSATAATTTMTRVANHRIAITNPMMSSTCKACKRWGLPCPLCAQSAPHPLPMESDWSNEDWNGDKKGNGKEKKREELQDQEKNKEKNVPNDYCPASLVYDPTFKQDLLPHCSLKEKLA